MELMSLRELCTSIGVTRRSIQCYEAAGLMIPVSKNKYGHLLYDELCKERAKKIHFMQDVGFKLSDIKNLIDAPSDVISKAFEKRLPELEQEEEHLREVIAEVRRFIEEAKKHK